MVDFQHIFVLLYLVNLIRLLYEGQNLFHNQFPFQSLPVKLGSLVIS